MACARGRPRAAVRPGPAFRAGIGAAPRRSASASFSSLRETCRWSPDRMASVASTPTSAESRRDSRSSSSAASIARPGSRSATQEAPRLTRARRRARKPSCRTVPPGAAGGGVSGPDTAERTGLRLDHRAVGDDDGIAAGREEIRDLALQLEGRGCRWARIEQRVVDALRERHPAAVGSGHIGHADRE